MAILETQGWQSGTKGGEAQPQKEGQSRKEGPIARAIEQQTAKLPSDIFLWAALASIGASLTFQLLGTRRGILDVFRPKRAPIATFVGQWAPTFLLLGIYNKLVKVAGSDRETSESGSDEG